MSEVTTQTLYVVAREVNNELNDARVALELFGEQQEEVAVLEKCREHLRLVRGALRLVEVFGAALLVEEMEQLAQYLIDHIAEKRHLGEGLDALMRAMVQLPTYLERVLGGGRDMALVLLPLLNDLRAVRGNPLLSEGTLLLLNLSSDKQANPQSPAPGEPSATASQWARKMRTRFQLGLLGWIKGERVDQNLEILARAAEKLEQVATTQSVFQLWWVVGAVLEGLREGGLDSTASVKRLLGQADREMKRLYEQGEQKYCEKPPLDLLNNLLYYVARAASDGARVAAVRASFRLNDLLPIDAQVEAARESLSAPSIKLMKTVANAIKEDLARVKDALDIFVRKGGTQLDELAPQLDLLKKIGDTLGVLGLGDLREKVQQQTGLLQGLLQSHVAADEASLMAMASTLINVEDALDSQLVSLITPENSDETTQPPTDKDNEFRQVSEAVLRECIVNMARIKEAIALTLERPGEAQSLEQIPHLIRGITAGLLMLGKSRAVEITERIRKALERYARPEVLPRMAEKMDRLADAIVAVEYYLETLQAGRSDPWYMLDNAEGCLQVLDEMSTGATGLYRIPQNLTNIVGTPAVESTVALSPQAQARMDHARHTEPTQVIRDQPLPVLTESRVAMSDHAVTEVNLPPVLVRPEDRANPEFVELFIEEAREEIYKLQQMLPRWDENPQDFDALTQIRRSFHTLKGSGRLVGAQLIGEFAWSMENMLNRLISKTLERTPDMVELLRQAVALLPGLVEQLESGKPLSGNVGALMAWAYTFAGTRDQVIRTAPVDTTGTVPALPADAAPVRSDPMQHVAAPTVAPAPTQIDPALHDIFAKEVAGHLTAIREYIEYSELLPPPYAVTEALHRACHTLSGASKTAAVRQSIKIAEPLNHYIRKLFDNNMPLPAAGLMVLKDAVTAIEHILSHVNEDSVFFRSQANIVSRVQTLEQQLDGELIKRDVSADATGLMNTSIRPMRAALGGASESDTNATATNHYMDIDFSGGAANKLHEASTIVEHDILGDSRNEDDDSEEDWVNLTVDDLQQLVDAPIETILRKGPFFSEAVATEKHGGDQTHAIEETMRNEALAEATVETPQIKFESAERAKRAELPVVADAIPVVMPASTPSGTSHVATPVNFATERRSPNRPMSKGPPLKSVAIPTPDVVEASDEDFDAEVAAIFTEEASELLELADSSLANWRKDRGNHAQSHELQRALHTLKGGARMAGIRAMGDLSHELESLMEVLESGAISTSPQVYEVLQGGLDELHRMRDVVSGGKNAGGAQSLLDRIRGLAKGEPIPAAISTVKPAPVLRDVPAESELPFITSFAGVDLQHAESGHDAMEHSIQLDLSQEQMSPSTFAATQIIEPVHTISSAPMEAEFGLTELQEMSPIPAFAPPTESTIDFELPDTSQVPELELPVITQAASPAISEATPIHSALPPGREQPAQERGEVARVDADLLDDLLNNAGEVSILRSRLEQQVSSVEFNLTELSRTVTRLKDQLRNLELETEAQILHKHQDDSHARDDFDPLELDRYSTIQQFSRALAESVSDVASIENLLGSMTREAQNLLLQQSRVVTELQNGLMRTRMVPFSRHVQRLTRLVRQVAGETGKQVELNVSGATGELDRQVLERMLPPFEHMLRNSIVHGIETPQARVNAGKPETGAISVKLHREGSEMIITLQDDGRGIDVNAVREKAKAKGMIPNDRILTDEEALQLILEPGFSTATTVTQHAGRGVGMDVVVNEIKKLGGALFTETKFGHGVKFTIRLPFTLAVSQSLLVRVGEHELYALPLPSIEGVVRLTRDQVETHLREATPTFAYGTQIYKFQHLGAFIDAGPSLLPEGDEPVPLVLIKAGEHSTALLVDELLGNREIVVKSVGPQVSGIRGISGAAILGDGRVVIILDMGALVRSEWRARPESSMLERGEDRRILALVVDDSITVRRVTQRLLERNGMRVLTAKDGVDAWEIMQEHAPDIILLDIEMPRMDGYELATQIRADARLRETPIIMITSRVSEKHRARAIEVGVNDYLGKPYQENQLLDAIEPLVRARRKRVN